MSKSPLKPLPHRLLFHLGRIATTTAYIEQEFVLWASAIYARQTGGRPEAELRMSFRRLLNKWHSEAVHRIDPKTAQRVLSPLRADLNRLWPIRNAFIHGRWRPIGRYKYQVDWWEQTKADGLKRYGYGYIVSLSDVNRQATAFDRLLVRIYRYLDKAAGRSPSPRKRGARHSRAAGRFRTKRT
jgi:hypothetical protein